MLHVIHSRRREAQLRSRFPVVQDVKSRRSMGIHCCTFRLTDEPLDEPVRLLKAATEAAALERDEFVVMQHGGLLATAGGRDAAVPPVL